MNEELLRKQINREKILDALYRRKEIIQNERDETYYQEELKEIENSIKFYEDE